MAYRERYYLRPGTGYRSRSTVVRKRGLQTSTRTGGSFRQVRRRSLRVSANRCACGDIVLLASFDVIDRIDVAGSHLVLTLARYNPERPLPPHEILHTSLEVCDRHTGAKLYEDVPLPDRSSVLGGGRFLYLLLDTHSPPWRIAKLRLLAN